jgi:hypothetical protein
MFVGLIINNSLLSSKSQLALDVILIMGMISGFVLVASEIIWSKEEEFSKYEASLELFEKR